MSYAPPRLQPHLSASLAGLQGWPASPAGSPCGSRQASWCHAGRAQATGSTSSPRAGAGQLQGPPPWILTSWLLFSTLLFTWDRVTSQSRLGGEQKKAQPRPARHRGALLPPSQVFPTGGLCYSPWSIHPRVGPCSRRLPSARTRHHTGVGMVSVPGGRGLGCHAPGAPSSGYRELLTKREGVEDEDFNSPWEGGRKGCCQAGVPGAGPQPSSTRHGSGMVPQDKGHNRALVSQGSCTWLLPSPGPTGQSKGRVTASRRCPAAGASW